MSKLKEFFYPRSVEEAIRILGDSSGKSAVIAGGSSLSLSGADNYDALVDITRAGLSYVKEDGNNIYIGATTTIQELSVNPVTAEFAGGMINDAASQIASRQLRNAITIGGNIAHLRIWSDMPIVLLALGASVKIQGNGERIISADDFFRENPKKILHQSDIVTEIIIPKTSGKFTSKYIKFSKTHGDYAIVSVGCSVVWDGAVCKSARIIAGAVSSLPVRCSDAENILLNQQATPDLIDKAAKICREKITPVSNVWGSADYKSEVIENLVRRALNACIAD